MGTYKNLCGHWATIHQAYILLYLCPFQGCGCEKMVAGDIRKHAEVEHGLKGESLIAFDSVPVVVQVVPNRNHKFPAYHSPLTSNPELPEGTFHFRNKIRASVMLQEKLHTLPGNHAPSTTKPPPPAPQPVAGSVSSAADLGRPVAVQPTTLSPPATGSCKVGDRKVSIEQFKAHLLGIRHREVTLWQERDEVPPSTSKGKTRDFLNQTESPGPSLWGIWSIFHPPGLSCSTHRSGTLRYMPWMGRTCAFWICPTERLASQVTLSSVDKS